ncbi:hypothetical protein JTB14_025272 [Gonioctena quinquepunctata]|nr:hypothetical protein JTB14_025272 [Gonioctena quinquepunctata]
MHRIILILNVLVPSISAQSIYTIPSAQQTLQYDMDCMANRRIGYHIHALILKDDQTRKLNFSTYCCVDYHIRFFKSSIPTFAIYSFGTRPNYVVDIKLDNTNISKILPGAFNGLNYLNCLDLSRNNIGFLQYGIFNGLQRLYILNLAYNQIKSIFDNAFDNVPLKKIYLGNNLISFLDDNLFSSQKNTLILMNLSNNNLREINNTFYDMKILETLILNHNEIEDINIGDIFCKKIYLRNNTVSRIRAVRNTTKVIDLSENNIKLLDNLGKSFINSSIIELYFTRNSIELNENSLTGLHSLTHLHLDDNKLIKIPNNVFKGLNSLIFLDISHNNISQFQYGTFDDVSNLQYLNVSHNKFAEAQLHILSPLHKLGEFDIRENQIANIDIQSFLYHCPYVKKIGLDGNIWKCKALTNIVKYCQTKGVEVMKGNSTDYENVRGIACDNDDFKREDNKTDRKVFDFEFLENSTFFNFFKDFERSHFYKYLENLDSRKSADPILLNTTSFYNFFEKDYKSSNFFKYLESLKPRDIKPDSASNEFPHVLFIFGTSLVVMLVLIFLTLFTVFVLIWRKSYEVPRNVSQENVELL